MRVHLLVVVFINSVPFQSLCQTSLLHLLFLALWLSHHSPLMPRSHFHRLSLGSACAEWWRWLSEEAVLLSLSLPLCPCVCCLIKCNKRGLRRPTPTAHLCSEGHRPSPPPQLPALGECWKCRQAMPHHSNILMYPWNRWKTGKITLKITFYFESNLSWNWNWG